jgi:receptor expression-enhancing protein 1/2/3/4
MVPRLVRSCVRPNSQTPTALTGIFRIPFYAYIRLLFLLYLVLPQTQGARIIYQAYVHPWLEENEGAIEDYIKRAIEYLKINVLGHPPTPESASTAAAPGPQSAQSYTQSLLSRFNLPAARWPGNAGAAGATGADFYNFLASAVSAAAGAAGSAGGSRDAEDIPSSTATLIPDSIRGAAARMSYLQSQRERLNTVLSALDREASQLQGEDAQVRGADVAEGLSSRSPSAGSGLSGLAKSRSEADFEKLEAESGEDEMEDGTSVRRRGPTPSASGSGGSWMPWGWGGSSTPTGSGGDTARSSGVEK